MTYCQGLPNVSCFYDYFIFILLRLLLPLAGPTPDDPDPEDVDMLPIDLQFLDEDKKVEEDPDIRKMLLEAVTQLCATKTCRQIVRTSQV